LTFVAICTPSFLRYGIPARVRNNHALMQSLSGLLLFIMPRTKSALNVYILNGLYSACIHDYIRETRLLVSLRVCGLSYNARFGASYVGRLFKLGRASTDRICPSYVGCLRR